MDQTFQVSNGTSALFVENQGQWSNASVRYGFSDDGVNIAFTDQGLTFGLWRREAAPGSGSIQRGGQQDRTPPLEDQFPGPDAKSVTRSAQVAVRFGGANVVRPVGRNQAAARFNYYVGDASTYRSNVPGFAVIEYPGLYDGIDLETFGRGDGLKYEFHVAPGADYRQIQVRYDGVEGLSIDRAGALHVETALGDLVEEAPYIYQQIGGQQLSVAGRFALVGADIYTVEITGPYDPAAELVIDPDLSWSTYLGGANSSGQDIAIDSFGNALVTGGASTGFPTTPGAFDPTYNGGDRDAYVAKFNARGSLVWSTYLGGGDLEFGQGIAVDDDGSALVTGYTQSTDFPTTPGAFDKKLGGLTDAFVAKFNDRGSLVWSTYLGGGDNDDGGWGIAVDAAGSALVTGFTYSSDFPTTPGAFDQTYNGGDNDAFVAKFSAGGSLLWSTYLGGSGEESGHGIAVDAAGDVLLAGGTTSPDFRTTPGAFDRNPGDDWDAFVVQFRTDGALLWSTYLGGEGLDFGEAIAVDADGSALVTGDTRSLDFPTTSGAFDRELTGTMDAFVAMFTASGSFRWGTYLGGAAQDRGQGIAVDAAGNALVIGETRSSDFPTTPDAFDPTYNGGDVNFGDAVVAKFRADGALLWSTYLGGKDRDFGKAIAVDTAGGVLLTGFTASSDFPTTPGAFDQTYNGGNLDAFLAKFGGLGSVLAGDMDLDGDVDFDDIDELVLGLNDPARYEAKHGVPAASPGDLDGDGDLDFDDIDEFIDLLRAPLLPQRAEADGQLAAAPEVFSNTGPAKPTAVGGRLTGKIHRQPSGDRSADRPPTQIDEPRTTRPIVGRPAAHRWRDVAQGHTLRPRWMWHTYGRLALLEQPPNERLIAAVWSQQINWLEPNWDRL